MRFAGYAAVFDRPDRGGDVVRRGAFAAAVASRRMVPLLWQHRPDAPIGRIEMIAEDSRGLRVIGRVSPDSDAGRAAVAALSAGALNGLSFGYRIRRGRQGTNRELTMLDLIEVSLVSHPMQPLARVHAVQDIQRGDEHVRSEG